MTQVHDYINQHFPIMLVPSDKWEDAGSFGSVKRFANNRWGTILVNDICSSDLYDITLIHEYGHIVDNNRALDGKAPSIGEFDTYIELYIALELQAWKTGYKEIPKNIRPNAVDYCSRMRYCIEYTSQSSNIDFEKSIQDATNAILSM
jgi:hypothetical protein